MQGACDISEEEENYVKGPFKNLVKHCAKELKQEYGLDTTSGAPKW